MLPIIPANSVLPRFNGLRHRVAPIAVLSRRDNIFGGLSFWIDPIFLDRVLNCDSDVSLSVTMS